jgi:hypothetical protein
MASMRNFQRGELGLWPEKGENLKPVANAKAAGTKTERRFNVSSRDVALMEMSIQS